MLVFIHNFCYMGARVRVQTSSPPGRGALPKLAVGGGRPARCTSLAALPGPAPALHPAAPQEHRSTAHGQRGGPVLHPSTHRGKGKPARMNVTVGNGTELSDNLLRSYYCSISQLDRNLGPKGATYCVADKHIPWRSPYPLPELRFRAYLLLFFPLK